MYIQSFKQAWNLLKQEKLFSTIYVVGTGLAITMVMVLTIIFYIKIADIYPETNRSRLLVVQRASEQHKSGSYSSSMLSYDLIERCFRGLDGLEATTAVYNNWEKHYVQPDGSKEQLPVTAKYVDTSFWTVFPFRFIQGKPFTEADMESGIYTAVIAESLAKRLFGNGSEAVGKYVSMDFRTYRVCGVVKDASYVTERTYALLWIPYTVIPDSKKPNMGNSSTLGRFSAYMLASSAGEVEKVRQAAVEKVRQVDNSLGDEVEFSIIDQPDRQWQSVFRLGNRPVNWNKTLLQYGLLFLVLLLVPAVSLSGMTDSRMERRLAEMGVRRAFGAPNHLLFTQVLTENLLYTLLGGSVGLLFSYIALLVGKTQLISLVGAMPFAEPVEGAEAFLTPDMLFNLPVFGIVLGVCFLLNLMSALIPAWRASKREIIYSLTAKQ